MLYNREALLLLLVFVWKRDPLCGWAYMQHPWQKKAYMHGPLGVEALLTRPNQVQTCCFKLTWLCSNSVFGEFSGYKKAYIGNARPKWLKRLLRFCYIVFSPMLGIPSLRWPPAVLTIAGGPLSLCSNWKRGLSYKNDKPRPVLVS